jgi:hypothetical protein
MAKAYCDILQCMTLNRITIRIAIYCHGILLLKKDQTNTEVNPHTR